VTAWERLENTFAGRETDRTPVLGGGFRAPITSLLSHKLLLTITGKIRSPSAFTRIAISEPMGSLTFSYRKVGGLSHRRRDELLEVIRYLARTSDRHVEEMPSGRQIKEAFDPDAAYREFQETLRSRQLSAVLNSCTCQHNSSWRRKSPGSSISATMHSHPSRRVPRARCTLLESGCQGHCIARTIARAVRGGLYPHAVLLGEDICGQRADDISKFLRSMGTPPPHSLQPLLKVGCRPVWHSDGNVLR